MRVPSCFLTLLCLALWISFAGDLPADENPFGLPTPRHQDRLGAVMLHGGGHGLRDEIRGEFVRLAEGKEARLVLMPSDECQLGHDSDGHPIPGGESRKQYERRLAQPQEYGRWVTLCDEGKVADFQFVYRDRHNDPDDAKLLKLLEQATGVWLPANDQEWLPTEFAAK